MKTILLAKPEGWTYQAMVPEDFRYRKVLLQDTGIDRTEHEVAELAEVYIAIAREHRQAVLSLPE